MQSASKKNKSEKLILSSIVLGAVIFYLPFICNQFMSDDWLWLANAKAALSNARLFFERPMYGYFRPLNLIWDFVLYNVFGAKAYIFSFFNILLHAINLFLFWKVLTRFDIKRPVRAISVLFFAFYFLDISAIGWISVGHDLWVVLLTLLFTLRMFKFIEKPGAIIFVQIILLGLAATLFKEAGFINIGSYLLMLLVYNKNPFARKFIPYTAIMGLVYSGYIALYFATRAYAARDVIINFHVLLNLWYFLAYLVSPFSERIVESVPHKFYWLIKFIRILTVMLIPVTYGYIFWKRQKALIYFALWSAMFLSTVAVFDWHFGIFDLFPDRTASRFMYVAIPGVSLIIAWFVAKIFAAFKNHGWRVRVAAILTAGFILGNWFVVKTVTMLYRSNQIEVNNIIADLQPLTSPIKDKGRLVVLTGDMGKTPQIVYSGIHLKAILSVEYDISSEVDIREVKSANIGLSGDDPNAIFALWDTSHSRLIPLAKIK